MKSVRVLTLATGSAIFCALLLLLYAGMQSPTLSADGGENGDPTASPVVQDLDGRSLQGPIDPPANQRLDPELNDIVESIPVAQGPRFGFGKQPNSPDATGPVVLVTVHVKQKRLGSVRTYLERNGASIVNAGDDYIETRVRAGLLNALSELKGVHRIEATGRGRVASLPNSSSTPVVSKGVEIHSADNWHEYGFYGEGVKIGVIDIGFEGFKPLMGTELPSSVTARCYSEPGKHTDMLSGCFHEGNHGTAVTETIYDMAPRASYYIANPMTPGDLHNTVEWMGNHGVDVINYSLSWNWDGPGDGTSPYGSSPLKAVDKAVEDGMLFVSAAGNARLRTFWTKRVSDPDGDGLLHVDNTECRAVSLEEGEFFRVFMRWEDDWSGASKNLDLLLVPIVNYDIDLDDVVATSEYAQDGKPHQIPMEQLTYTSPDGGLYCLAVRASLDPGEELPGWFQVRAWDGGIFINWSVYGHITSPAESANPGMIAVGATSYFRNAISGLLEPSVYSSWGPTPDERVKPDITGYACGETSSIGAFCGTSQAAAHVTGVAALLIDRYPWKTPAQIKLHIRNVGRIVPYLVMPQLDFGWGIASLLEIYRPVPNPTPVPDGMPILVSEFRADASNNFAKLSWALEEPPGDGYIGEMYLEHLDGDGNATESDHVESDPSYGNYQHSVNGLSPGVRYRFRVRLEMLNGSNLYSKILTVTTENEGFKPPTNLTATTTDETVTLSWTVPDQPDWVPDDVVMWVMWGNISTSTPIEVGSVPWERGISDYTLTVEDLYPGMPYQYFIRVNVGNELHHSDELMVRTLPVTEDPDSTRAGATLVLLGSAWRQNGPYHINYAGNDLVDYYKFTIDSRTLLGFWFIEIGFASDVFTNGEDGITLEDSSGDTIVERHELLHDQVIDAGTYYIRVEPRKNYPISYYFVLFEGVLETSTSPLAEPQRQETPQPTPETTPEPSIPGAGDSETQGSAETAPQPTPEPTVEPTPEPTPDPREAAESLGDQDPTRGRQFFRDKSLDPANGDSVDYYVFRTDARYELGLGVRGQGIEVKVTLEDADGNEVGVAGPPLDPKKDQVYIEWLLTDIEAGTYYIRVEALEERATDYYIRFGLKESAAGP